MTEKEFRRLLEDYLHESISKDDFYRLWESLKRSEYQSIWDEAMEEMLANPELRDLSDEQSMADALRKVKDAAVLPNIEVVAERKTLIRRILAKRAVRWMAAASIILVSGAAIWNWRVNNDEIRKEIISRDPVSIDVMPGGNKAVLTLADGSVIRLDDAMIGKVGTQGTSNIIKVADGQLLYQAEGKNESIELMNTLVTPRGGQYAITLPDGTKVWLNAASSITYPVQFVDKYRKVYITGEVYFEVSKNEYKPFVVDVDGKSLITVLGTHFNINSYQDEGSINTTLLEGKVRVATAAGDTAILAPNNQAMQYTTGPMPLKLLKSVDIDQVVAWKNGTFNFNRTPLQSVMRQIERWYDIEVVYDQSVPKINFGGEIKRDLTLVQLLEGIQKMGIHCEIKDKILYVKP